MFRGVQPHVSCCIQAPYVGLTPYTPPVYTLFMPTPTPRPIGQRPDGTWKPAGTATIARAFRITKDQHDELAKEPYSFNASLLVRMLLKLYFEDKIPAAKFNFMKLLQTTKE